MGMRNGNKLIHIFLHTKICRNFTSNGIVVSTRQFKFQIGLTKGYRTILGKINPILFEERPIIRKNHIRNGIVLILTTVKNNGNWHLYNRSLDIVDTVNNKTIIRIYGVESHILFLE